MAISTILREISNLIYKKIRAAENTMNFFLLADLAMTGYIWHRWRLYDNFLSGSTDARRREIRKEDKAKVQGEPSSRPRCLDALRSPDNCESTRRKKTAKSLAKKKPCMDNPDNSVSSLSADVFSTALDSDINQLNDRFDVPRQEKLAQSEF